MQKDRRDQVGYKARRVQVVYKALKDHKDRAGYKDHKGLPVRETILLQIAVLVTM
jgi:hypothetical protein